MPIPVRLQTADHRLESALRQALDGDERFTLVPRTALPPGVIVAPTPDLTPDRCAVLRAAGWHIVVLAAIPRETDHNRYRVAGVSCYIAMTIGTRSLQDAIVSAGCCAGFLDR